MDLDEQISALREELEKKTQKHTKLKDVLTKSMRSDKRKEQQIESLQIELNDKEKHIKELNTQLTNQKQYLEEQDKQIASLEDDLKSLRESLNGGEGSEAALMKADRLKRMISKSNDIYTDLKAKYDDLRNEIELAASKKPPQPHPKRAIILSDSDVLVLMDDGTYQMENTIPSTSIIIEDYRKEEEDLVFPGYLRDLFVEFFSGSTGEQSRIIPIILQLLGVPQQQISAAQRAYSGNIQLISKFQSSV